MAGPYASSSEKRHSYPKISMKTSNANCSSPASFSEALLVEMGQNEEFQIHASNPDELSGEENILLTGVTARPSCIL